MAIRTVVTGGFGNGTFDGTIPLVVTDGFAIGVVVVSPFIPFPAFQATDINLVPSIRSLIEANLTNLLSITGCNNIWPMPIPPITTWEQMADLFRMAEGSLRTQANLEAWFVTRERVLHPLSGMETRYPQIHSINIRGFAWHGTFDDSRHYIQTQGEKIIRTLERNKGLMLGPGAELTAINARFFFRPLGETSFYQTIITANLSLEIQEIAGRNAS